MQIHTRTKIKTKKSTLTFVFIPSFVICKYLKLSMEQKYGHGMQTRLTDFVLCGLSTSTLCCLLKKSLLKGYLFMKKQNILERWELWTSGINSERWIRPLMFWVSCWCYKDLGHFWLEDKDSLFEGSTPLAIWQWRIEIQLYPLEGVRPEMLCSESN